MGIGDILSFVQHTGGQAHAVFPFRSRSCIHFIFVKLKNRQFRKCASQIGQREDALLPSPVTSLLFSLPLCDDYEGENVCGNTKEFQKTGSGWKIHFVGHHQQVQDLHSKGHKITNNNSSLHFVSFAFTSVRAVCGVVKCRIILYLAHWGNLNGSQRLEWVPSRNVKEPVKVLVFCCIITSPLDSVHVSMRVFNPVFPVLQSPAWFWCLVGCRHSFRVKSLHLNGLKGSAVRFSF